MIDMDNDTTTHRMKTSLPKVIVEDESKQRFRFQGTVMMEPCDHKYQPIFESELGKRRCCRHSVATTIARVWYSWTFTHLFISTAIVTAMATISKQIMDLTYEAPSVNITQTMGESENFIVCGNHLQDADASYCSRLHQCHDYMRLQRNCSLSGLDQLDLQFAPADPCHRCIQYMIRACVELHSEKDQYNKMTQLAGFASAPLK
jgi:hypothetical protein